MTERAKALGISEADLKRALILTRELRIQAVREGLDPRAIRIALLFIERCDRHFAVQKLHPVTFAALESIATELYELARSPK